MPLSTGSPGILNLPHSCNSQRMSPFIPIGSARFLDLPQPRACHYSSQITGSVMKIVRIIPVLVATLQLVRADDKVDFAKSIQPVLEKRCIECHGKEKQKVGLRLDSKDAALKGSEDGKVIIVGKPDESSLVKRISLPEGHDDIMPPKGDPLTKEQIELIKKWIAEGANWPEGLVLSGEKAAAEEPAK